MPSRLAFYYPGKRFPAFSVTGDRCELRCEHCQGRYLHGMRPTLDPATMAAEARKEADRGSLGLLVSGGCDHRGRVPIGPFLGTISDIKRTTNLAINVHTGLLDEEEAVPLRDTGADALSMDLLQDQEALWSLNLEAGPLDYRRTLEALAPSRCAVPHILVGLQSLRGEEACLDLLSEVGARAVIALGLMSPGRPDLEVPEGRLLRFVRAAVETLDIPVVIGCMRPRGRWEEEVALIKAGASGMVNPSLRTLEWAQSEGLSPTREEICCALHR